MIKAMTSLLPLLPSQEDSSPIYPRHQRYHHRNGTGNQHHFPSLDQGDPNSHLLLVAWLHRRSFSPGIWVEVVGEKVRLQGNAGWWYVDSQSLESSEYLEGSRVHQQRENGSGHLPTEINELAGKVTSSARPTLSIQNPPLRSIMVKKSSYSLLRNQSNRAISKLLQK